MEQKGPDFAYDLVAFCSCNDIEDYKGDEITFLLYLGKGICQGKTVPALQRATESPLLYNSRWNSVENNLILFLFK